MQVGFTIVCRRQQVELRLLDRDADSARSLVSLWQSANHTAVLLGRLHYRDELLAELAPDWPEKLGEECRANDAALAAAVYRRWGRAGLARLEGDYAVVVWDAQERRLLASRDPLGGYPLFWTQTSERLALSTSLQALLVMRNSRSLDLDYLAEYVMLPLCSMPELPDGRSAYQGVRRLPSGCTLSVHLPGWVVEQHRYWNWLERRIDPDTDRLEEVAVRYGELLRHAVRERLHGRVAAHLSGGMDSTAVSLIARDQLDSRNGGSPLHALALVYERLSSLVRERPYLEGVLGEQRGLIAHRIAADDVLDFDSFAAAPPHDEPCPSLWSIPQEEALLNRAAQVGAATVLTGHGADGMLEMMPYHLTELLRGGRLWSAWREACRWATASNSSPWKYLVPFGLANLLPARVRARWSKQGSWTVAPWILPGFARRHDLRGRARRNIRRLYGSCRPVGLSVALGTVSDSGSNFIRWYLGAPQGIHVTHPFLDARLLCFSLGMQTRLRRDPRRQKPVLAEAMRAVLPEKIRTRPRKGHFNEVYFRGLARNRTVLEELIRRSRVEELGLLDKEVLQECLQQAALGTAGTMLDVSRLNAMLSLLQWLALEESRTEPAASAREGQRPSLTLRALTAERPNGRDYPIPPAVRGGRRSCTAPASDSASETAS